MEGGRGEGVGHELMLMLMLTLTLTLTLRGAWRGVSAGVGNVENTEGQLLRGVTRGR